MRKKKDIVIDEDEKFVIPMIVTIDKSLFSGLNVSKPSEACSPYHGTNVYDRQHIVDNTGSTDIDYGYDFVRDEEKKHLTKEELIAKYGTEYYEFGINKKSPELYEGADYSKNKDIKKSDYVSKEVSQEFGFIESVNDLLNDDLKRSNPEEFAVNNANTNTTSINPDDVSLPAEETIPKYENVKKENTQESNDDLNEFNTLDTSSDLDLKLDIDIDSNDNFEYNSFDENMAKPEPVDVSAYTAKNTKEDNFNFDNDDEESHDVLDDLLACNSEISFDNIPNLKTPDIKFEDQINIEEEPTVDDSKLFNEPTVNEQPKVNVNQEYQAPKEDISFKENISFNEVPSTPVQVKKNNYVGYHIPIEKIFKKTDPTKYSDTSWLEEKKEIINQALKSFGIDGEVKNYTKGPAFTQYEILLAPGVNVNKISHIEDNLKAVLQAKAIRIQAPIPGKATVGIEAPNKVAEVVSFGDIVTPDFLITPKNLTVALGKNIDGSPVFQNIADMPHCLIAGATQSGKSVCINTIIISLLVKNSPDDLKLILVDPKKVELAFYNELPHLATPVIDDPLLATEALKWACEEMDNRYDIFATTRVRNIGDYNKKRKDNPELKKLPFIVIIVDEFNDLVMQSGQEVNDCIIRIAQKARACGIHLILATQRPTVKVVNGTIKANVPCRIAFRVASAVDSSTILDEVGAENLLGRGDMLIKNNSDPIRAQGAYISDDEIDAVCNYLTSNYEPDFLFTEDDLKKRMRATESGSSNDEESNESPRLLYEIASFCVENNVCSINYIQSSFNLGFNRAQRIVSTFEKMEIVSPKNGTKSREILVDSYQLRQIFHVDD